MDLLEVYLNIKSAMARAREIFSRTFNNEAKKDDLSEDISVVNEVHQIEATPEEMTLVVAEDMSSELVDEIPEDNALIIREEAQPSKEVKGDSEEQTNGVARVIPIMALLALLIKVVAMYIGQSITGKTAKDEIVDRNRRSASARARERSSVDEVSLKRAEKVRKSKKSKRRKNGKRKTVVAIVSATAAVFVVGLFGLMYFNHQMEAVKINGEFVGYAANKAECEAVLDEAKNSLAKQKGNPEIIFDESVITYKLEYVENIEKAPMVEEEVLIEKMIANDAVSANAYSIIVNDTPVASVATEEASKYVLEEVEKIFLGDNPETAGQFVDTVTIEKAQKISIEELAPAENVIEHLLNGGGEDQEIYEIQDGDTIETICAALNEPEENVRASNPDVDFEEIKAGDYIVVNVIKPLVNYQTSSTVTVNEEIPFETLEEETEELFEDETEVKSEGEVGSKIITLEETRINGKLVESKEIETVVEKEPVDFVTLIGTKKRVVVVVVEPEEEPEVADDSASDTSEESSNSTSDSSDSSSSDNSEASSSTESEKPAPPAPSASGSGIVADAHNFLGVPYVYGGSSPSGFDCSGLVQYVYRANGITTPRTAAAISKAGAYVPLSEAVPGDIVCWGSPGSSGHVGIYIGGNQYIHAPVPGQTVRIASYGYNNPSFAVRF